MTHVQPGGGVAVAHAGAGERAAPARVVINGRFLAQVKTGVQRYALQTVLALDRLLDEEPPLRRRLAFELAVPARAATLELRHIRIKVLPWLHGHFWEQLALPLRAGSSYLVNFGYSGPLAKRRQLITLHDAAARAVARAYTWRYRFVHDVLVHLLRGRVDTVMTVSRFSRAELARRYGVSHALLGIEGWQHCVAAGDGLETLRRFDLQPRGYILAVGGRQPHKNVDLLDRAVPLLGDFPLAIAIAGGPAAGIFRSGAALPRGVRLLGFVGDAQLAHLYRHAEWLVLPSLYEGFGLPALEAMGNGCPVLAAHAAALPEVCADAALYFDPHDPATLAALLQQVARAPALRSAMVAKARARCARFSWAANARILVDHLLGAAA